MAWAEGRRLQSVTQNGQTHSYQYNADGLRIKKTNPDGTYIVYHIADGRYVGETHYNALSQRVKYLRYTYDENDRVCGIGVWYAGQSKAWEEYYFETNLQGDVIAVYTAANGTNELPQLVASYTYDAWGNILTSTGSLADLNPFRYRGYYFDNETEFYYLQSRYYDPTIGRFINADSFASTGQDFTGYNMFAYCGNNPVVYKDIFGYMPSYTADTNGDGIDDCYIYEYTHTTIYHMRGIRKRVNVTGKVYIYSGYSRDEFLTMSLPTGFNSYTDLMVLDITDARNPNLLARQAHLVGKKFQNDVIDCMLQYNEDFSTKWKRTKESLSTEWFSHNAFAMFHKSAQDVDFDNDEEGCGFGYYVEKAWNRFIDALF